MRIVRSRQVWLAAMIVPAGVGALRGGPGKDPDPERIAALVRQLGDKRYAHREAAGQGLVEVGEKALPAVRAAATSPDLEVSTRARQVALAILQKHGGSKSTGMPMVAIPDGKFNMGSSAREAHRRPDELLHPIRITRPFLLGKYEVTQAEYDHVMKINPSHFRSGGQGSDKVSGMDATKFPVERVTWFDAIAFCNQLSKLDGYDPYYELVDYKREAEAIVAGTVTIRGGNGYRLPTEAEWEYACRGPTIDRFHFGWSNSGRDANTQPAPATGYGGGPDWKPLNRTAAVGSYPVNPFGLYDMHGNVAEWCEDWYDRTYYAASPKDDPPGPATGTQRVYRGGSWLVAEASCRSASRLARAAGERDYYLGFRVARSP